MSDSESLPDVELPEEESESYSSTDCGFDWTEAIELLFRTDLEESVSMSLPEADVMSVWK